MDARRPRGLASPALDAGLASDPRLLSEPKLLAAVHCQLRRDFGERDAEAALLQAGFLHGLRDALGVARGTPVRMQRESAAIATAPLLPLRLTSAPDAHGPALRGRWPQEGEAEAVLRAIGPCDTPSCLVSMGYTSGWLSALGDGDVLAVELRCAAAGDEDCEFEARDAAAWRARGDARAAVLLAALPFAALRDAIARERRADEPDDTGAFDSDSAAVHVWGPVMIVPYAGEETAASVDAVARDPGAAAVSVVVVDLAGAVVDDGFGAVALERVVDVIHGWGAEAVIAGISPLSERVVANLAGDPILVPKDLRNAIAVAFQIAESQRRAL